MKDKNLIEILFISFCLCGLGYSLIKSSSQESSDISNEAVAIEGDQFIGSEDIRHDVIEELPETINEHSVVEKKRGRLISQHIKVESKPSSVLPYVSYQFQVPLLPKGRLLDFRLLNNVFWFSGDKGLVAFDLSSQDWFMYDKRNGLPGDTAYGLEVIDGDLVLEILNWTEKGSLTQVGTYKFKDGEFKDGKFTALKGSIETVEAGVYLSRKLTGLGGGVNDIIQFNGFTWASFRGKHISREVGFKGGGVAQLTSENELVKTHTATDGLSHSYAYKMTVMRDRSLWLSHFDEERGLSVLYTGDPQWKSVKKSLNDIDLGGVSLGSIKDVLVIGQQRGLVFYNTKTRKAYQMEESMGLPGYIVTGIQTVGETVWVSAYSYAKGAQGQRSTGLIKFEYRDIALLLE